MGRTDRREARDLLPRLYDEERFDCADRALRVSELGSGSCGFS